MRWRRLCCCLADRKTPYVRAPAVTVGRINSWEGVWHSAVQAAGQRMNQPPEPTAAAYRMHKYNW